MRLAAAIALVALTAPLPARAFCGCMVPVRAGQPLVNRASMVVLVRDGDRTVLTMRNDYGGPAEDFALVIPIPSAVDEDDVRTLDPAVFERLDRLTAPRLYDYYERDPCWTPGFPSPSSTYRDMGLSGFGSAFGTLGTRGGGPGGVSVERRFEAGEYDVAVLGASDSSALERWLTRHGYHVPEGFADAVRPYVEAGSRFLVARVNAGRLTLEDGWAVLSPLRVAYRSEEFALPIRLGRLNGDGDQDVVLHIIAPGTRYEVAGLPHTTIPTHYRVDESVRASFEEFYEALFAATLERHPGAVVTEWAAGIGGAGTWDTALGAADLRALAEPFLVDIEQHFTRTDPIEIDRARMMVRGPLPMRAMEREMSSHVSELRHCYEVAEAEGGDVELRFTFSNLGRVVSASATGETPALEACLVQAIRRWQVLPFTGAGTLTVVYQLASPWRGEPASARDGDHPRWTSRTELVMTRLHLRYGDGLSGDLAFRPAPPITGGTYTHSRREEGPWIVRAAREHGRNHFEARYFIGHEFEGSVNCGEAAVRGVWVPGFRNGEEVGPYAGMDEQGEPPPRLTEIVLEDLFREAVPELELTPRAPVTHEEEAPPTRLLPVGGAPETEERSGCGCRAAPARSAPWLLLAGVALLAWIARRR